MRDEPRSLRVAEQHSGRISQQPRRPGKHSPQVKDLQKHHMDKKGQTSVRLRDQYEGVCLCAALLGKWQPCAKRPCRRANDIMIREQIFSQTGPLLGAFVSDEQLPGFYQHQLGSKCRSTPNEGGATTHPHQFNI